MPNDLPGRRPVWGRWAGAALVAVLLTGCTGEGAPSHAAAGTRAVASEVRGADSPPAVAPGAVLPSIATPSIRDVVTSRALVGLRVRVTGRCLQPGREHALGQPPRPSHEWQLEAEGVAVFVIGPQPRGCRETDLQPVTITALVAEDTLPAIGELPPAPRRFLVFAGEEVR